MKVCTVDAVPAADADVVNANKRRRRPLEEGVYDVCPAEEVACRFSTTSLVVFENTAVNHRDRDMSGDGVGNEPVVEESAERQQHSVRTPTLTFADLPVEDPRDKKFRACTLKSRIAVFRYRDAF